MNNREYIMNTKIKSRVFIFELWYQYMKNILDDICDTYEIDDECREMLYKIHLRPNEYVLRVIGD
jgi:hypothetical protein